VAECCLKHGGKKRKEEQHSRGLKKGGDMLGRCVGWGQGPINQGKEYGKRQANRKKSFRGGGTGAFSKVGGHIREKKRGSEKEGGSCHFCGRKELECLPKKRGREGCMTRAFGPWRFSISNKNCIVRKKGQKHPQKIEAIITEK